MSSIIFFGIQPAHGPMATYSQLVTIDPGVQSNPAIAYIIGLLNTSEGAAARSFRLLQSQGLTDAYCVGTSDFPSSASDKYDQDANNFRDLGRLTPILNGDNVKEHHCISPAPASLLVAEFLQRSWYTLLNPMR
jgi:hypothetical protein